jgi:hypothetical protein
MRRGANRLALPSSPTRAPPGEFLDPTIWVYPPASPKQTAMRGEKRRCASCCLLLDQIIAGVSLEEVISMRPAMPSADSPTSLPNRAHSFATRLIRKVMKCALAAKTCLRPSSHSEPIGCSGPEPRLRATLSSRFNPALPAFSRTEFVAKDVAIEDSTCARGR